MFWERGFWEWEWEKERGEVAAGVLVWCGVCVVERVDAGGGRRRRVRSVCSGGRMSNVEGGGRGMVGVGVDADGILGADCRDVCVLRYRYRIEGGFRR